MLAWSLVGFAFGGTWNAVQQWLEHRLHEAPNDPRAARRFKVTSVVNWMTLAGALLFVGQALGSGDDPVWMSVFSLFLTPIALGYRSMLEPRIAAAPPRPG
jgi:uncharacterized membrane protein YbhN (UPF0104 family)